MTVTSAVATGAGARRRRWARRTPVLTTASLAVTVLLLLPLVFMILQAQRAGWPSVVVAARDLPAGHRHAAADLPVVRWPEALCPDGAGWPCPTPGP